MKKIFTTHNFFYINECKIVYIFDDQRNSDGVKHISAIYNNK